MVAVWLLSLGVRDASVVDSFWGLGFVLVAGVSLFAGQGLLERRLLVFGLVAVWGVRLSVHITRRNWDAARTSGTGGSAHAGALG